MDRRSERIFEKHQELILKHSAGLYDIKTSDLKKLGSFESFVYEFEANRQSFILKITHSIHRTKNQIMGELDWTNYLSENGINTAKPIQTNIDTWVEQIDIDDSYFLVYAFEKVDGRHITKDDWNNSLFRKWGTVTGKMHALTKNYKSASDSTKRINVFDDGFFLWEKQNLDSFSQPKVIERCKDVISKLRQFPIAAESYGLIHTDLHAHNFFINNGDFTIFDFDDCAYNWFAHDIAIPLFYELQSIQFEPRNKEFAQRFFRYFMEGYSKENQIGAFWIKQIPLFMKMREIDCYLIIKEEDAIDDNEWCRRYMSNRHEKIENDIPVIDLDFENLV